MGQNWGNLASVAGLILSGLAWREAKNAQQILSSWQRRDGLRTVRDTLYRVWIRAKQLRTTRAANWPDEIRFDIRDSLLEVASNANCPEKVLDDLKRHLAELRHPVESKQASHYLETLVEDVISATNLVERLLTEADHDRF